MPFAYPEAADLGARLAQIFLEGYGERGEADFLLRWKDVYALLRHPELSAYRDALFIPALFLTGSAGKSADGPAKAMAATRRWSRPCATLRQAFSIVWACLPR